MERAQDENQKPCRPRGAARPAGSPGGGVGRARGGECRRLAFLAIAEGSSARLGARHSRSTHRTAGGRALPDARAPEGKGSFSASRVKGNWDLFLQRVGGKNATLLTPDTASDESQPAFSPGGDRIAFRSNRERAGI